MISRGHVAGPRRSGANQEAADALRDSALLRLGNKDEMQAAQEVFRNVFLGPFSVARDETKLKELGITHIICLSAEGNCSVEGITYLEHALVEVDCTLEAGAAQLSGLIPSCVNFTRSALSCEDGRAKVLIHCLHGKTRSAAITSSVRAALSGETFVESYGAIKRIRNVHVPDEWHAELSATVDQLL